jgi:hypothetical protein
VAQRLTCSSARTSSESGPPKLIGVGGGEPPRLGVLCIRSYPGYDYAYRGSPFFHSKPTEGSASHLQEHEDFLGEWAAQAGGGRRGAPAAGGGGWGRQVQRTAALVAAQRCTGQGATIVLS